MNVVDSSGWLEYFADGPNADFFAPAIEDAAELVVPTISLYEVFKRALLHKGEDEALATRRQHDAGQRHRSGYKNRAQRSPDFSEHEAADGRQRHLSDRASVRCHAVGSR